MNDRQSISQNAIQLTKKIKAITHVLKDVIEEKKKYPNQKLNTRKLHPAIEAFSKQNNAFKHLLDAIAHHHPNQTITDPHLNYFLLSVLRYNAIFMTLQDKNAEQKNPPSAISHICEHYKGYLFPIEHALVGYNQTNFSYQKIQANTHFREHKEEIYRDQKRYMYKSDMMHPDHLEARNFVEGYKHCNKKIAAATQLSNIRNFFTAENHSKLSASYWRGKERSLHQIERSHFRSATSKIKSGLALSSDEKNVLDKGQYYRGNGTSKPFTTASQPSLHPSVFHNGHASVFWHFETASIAIDPINEACGSKLFYPRHTDPGADYDSFPMLPVVIYSHNHYDHLDEATLKKSMHGMDPLIIVPVGDGALMRAWGFNHVVELNSWNEAVEIERDGKTLVIHAFPARHASNRVISPTMPDINTSLFMGYLIHQKEHNHVSLVTGDTAVLDDDHLIQLEEYLLTNNLTVSSACLAAGPDRPRRYLECTHQSTADAITLHARLNCMNAKVMEKRQQLAAREDKEISPTITKADFLQAACKGIGYHQGCFRLGVLNYNDVEGTLTRTLAVLNYYGELPLEFVLKKLQAENDDLKKLKANPNAVVDHLQNYYFSIMDQFERDGLINTLKAYQNTASYYSHFNLTASDIKDIISKNTFIPQPGLLLDFNQANHHHTFQYQYERMIVNRHQGVNYTDDTYFVNRAYEEMIKAVKKKSLKDARTQATIHYLDPHIDPKQWVELLLQAYLDKTPKCLATYKKQKKVKKFLLKKLPALNDSRALKEALIHLRGDIFQWQTADDYQRHEGHFETTLLILMGLLDNPSFKRKFIRDYHAINPQSYLDNRYACLLGALLIVAVVGIIGLSTGGIGPAFLAVATLFKLSVGGSYAGAAISVATGAGMGLMGNSLFKCYRQKENQANTYQAVPAVSP